MFTPVHYIESGAMDVLLEQQSNLGVMLVSESFRVLYVNETASELGEDLDMAASSQNPDGSRKALPRGVMKVCRELKTYVRAPGGRGDDREFMVQRLAGEPDQPILIRGFRVQGSRGKEGPFFLILLERIEPRGITQPDNPPEQAGLTPRQQAVIECLKKGLTNKEIGQRLGVAEDTVKKHLHSIFLRTHCSSRTALVIRSLS